MRGDEGIAIQADIDIGAPMCDIDGVHIGASTYGINDVDAAGCDVGDVGTSMRGDDGPEKDTNAHPGEKDIGV